MRIRNNISSINSTRNQGINQGNMAKSLEKLSTGYKINRAGDNAAGLALSEGMRRQIYGLKQAMGNVKDGIGLVNTGEGALTEVHSMLQRLNTLAVQAANGTYNSTARSNITGVKEANEALPKIKKAVEAVSLIRSDFGSVYTHLKHTYSSISITRENMQASESAIRDTSMCDEFTNYTRDNILLQSAQAMMVQANAMSNNVLSLLQ